MRLPAFVRNAGLAGLLWLAAAMPLRAQRPDSTRAGDHSARQDSAAAILGPRLEDRWQPARLQFPYRSAPSPLASSEAATLRFTTLELVLILVIVLLLIVR